MATRATRNASLKASTGLTVRNMNNNKNTTVGGAKRALEEAGSEAKRRRAAFGDLTNAHAINKQGKDVAAKVTKKVVRREGGKKKTIMTVAVPRPTQSKKVPVMSSSQPEAVISERSEGSVSCSQPEKLGEVSFDYVELSQGSQISVSSSRSSSSQSSPDCFVSEMNEKNLLSPQDSEVSSEVTMKEEDEEFDDVDKEHLNDPFQCGLYAAFIFQYYKERELQFMLDDFLKTVQKDLTPNMRAILVDWLVEVQENFELNHETLYLAVKLVDHYLNKQSIPKERLQLLGATCLFIACKFDERCPPVLDDFLYICDDAYQREELIRMEMKVLRTIGFDLGIPLSYRFLRRYAKCARVAMDTLTLGRYILETSLMQYKFTQRRDSLMAAASLLLAMTMKNTGEWNATMVHYTGYQKSDILDIVSELNKMISAPASKHLVTIRSKYSHKVFHQVALIAPLTEAQLQELGCKLASPVPASSS